MGDEMALLSRELERLGWKGELEISCMSGCTASSSLEIRKGLIGRMG
jgi:hypothetical protein